MIEHALRGVRDGLLGLAFPEDCRVCGESVESWDDGVACSRCWNDPSITRLLVHSLCDKCGAPMASGVSRRTAGSMKEDNRFCGQCTAQAFTKARACGLYSGTLEASILFLKSSPHVCPRLRRLLCATFGANRSVIDCEIVVPVPLHRAREKQRGFNQAVIIAEVIASNFDLTLDKHSLERIKPTERHRAGMDAADRAKSVELAFKVATSHSLNGASVLLVDDVMTTGSTVSAASRALLDAGALRVNVLTIARVDNTARVNKNVPSR